MPDPVKRMMAAILRAPRDDAVRLRLADDLAARGDPRGEFIRVQVELARLGRGTEEADQLARRERELLARHEAEWVGPLADWLLAWTFHRGFIEEVVVEAGTFLAHAEDLFGAAPVESLHVPEAGAVSAECAACPYLARFRRLRFGSDDGDGEPLGDEGVAALARSPHLTGVEGVTFAVQQIGAGGLRALAGAPWLRSLRSLGLAQNEVGDTARTSALAAAPLEKLEVLNLDWTDAGSGTIEALAQSAALGELRDLNLNSNEIGGTSLASLAASTRLPRLTI